MRGLAGKWLVDTWLASLKATTPFAALHTAAPSPADPKATEVIGGWYARKAITWDTLTGTSLANAGPVSWTSMPAITLAGVALYTTSTGASLILWVPYAAPLAIVTGGSVTVGTHDLYVEVV